MNPAVIYLRTLKRRKLARVLWHLLKFNQDLLV
jgi:hypothetical protein